MFVFKAAVVGAGTMGAEIAHTIAGAGIPVVLKDTEASRVESALERARTLWRGRVDAGKLQSAELDRSMALISGTRGCTGSCSKWSVPLSSRSPPSTRSRSAAGASSRWAATCGSRPIRPRSASRRLTWDHSPLRRHAALPRLVGESAALEMNLTGDPIDSARAFELGLVTRVVPDHELLDTALLWARKLSAQAPLAIEQIKRVSAPGDLERGLEVERQGFAGVFASADAREGISAFLQKRPARFEGR